MTFFLISVLKFKCYKQKNRPFFELFRLNGFPEKLLIEFHGSNFYNEESFCVNISRIKKLRANLEKICLDFEKIARFMSTRVTVEPMERQ